MFSLSLVKNVNSANFLSMIESMKDEVDAMKHFHGNKKARQFFEGWYFKQHKGEDIISFIPGVQIDENGCAYAFIQVITKDESHFFTFSISEFYADPKVLFIRIGKNVFTKQGICIDIDQENSIGKKLRIQGNFHYYNMSKPNYPIMGPFQYIPLPCKHAIISMRHQVKGRMQLNGKQIEMSQGIGYLEKDYGSSFPKNYLWTQANAKKCMGPQVSVSIATLPICCREIQGCIAVIKYQGKEYRLATYLGAKVLIIKESLAIIRQGRWTLCIHMDKVRRPQVLLAPCKGKLSRKINEDIKCVIRYTFYHGTRKVFDWTTRNASVEFVTSRKDV